MKKFLVLALPVFAAAVPASAQDTAVGGFRVEGIVGYDRVDLGLRDEDFPAGPNALGTGGQPTGKLDGVFYGGTIGYDFGLGGMMLGVDAEYTESTADRTIFNLPAIREDDAELKIGRDLYVGGRATFALSPRFNVYGKLGYTRLRVSLDIDDEFEDDFFDDDDGDFRSKTNLDGIRGGLGLTYSPDGPAYYGLEGRYSNYEDGVDRMQLGLVIGFRFGGTRVAAAPVIYSPPPVAAPLPAAPAPVQTQRCYDGSVIPVTSPCPLPPPPPARGERG